MERIKSTFLAIVIIALIVILPVGLFTTFFTWLMDAIKWVVFVDNAETGLPMAAEIIIKGICESIVLSIAVGLGISKNNPFISIASIIVGFIVCIAIYAICKYIVWIALAIGLLVVGLVIFAVIRNKREKTRTDINALS